MEGAVAACKDETLRLPSQGADELARLIDVAGKVPLDRLVSEKPPQRLDALAGESIGDEMDRHR